MNSLNETEARTFLRELFPGGLSHSRLLAELCPVGWRDSPLFACFHPPPAMAYREYLALQETIRSLDRSMAKHHGWTKDLTPPPEEPDLGFDEFCDTHADEWGKRPADVEPIGESVELLALCLWDVFSDNHEVVAADGRIVDLGSFRGTAGEIADFFDESLVRDADGMRGARDRSDYMRFYMGTIWVAGRADLAPVYRVIFHRLKACGARWSYDFPKFRHWDPAEIAEHAGIPYDLPAVVVDDTERKACEDEQRRIKAKLYRKNLAAQREARKSPPPDTVRAYQEVYGCLPAGWPPDPYQLE